MATVLASLDSSSHIQQKKMDRLNEFLKVTSLDEPLKGKLRKYFSLYAPIPQLKALSAISVVVLVCPYGTTEQS